MFSNSVPRVDNWFAAELGSLLQLPRKINPQEKCKTLGRFALSPISRAASSRVFYQLVSSLPTFSTELFKTLWSFLDHAHQKTPLLIQGNVGTKVCKTYLNCSGLRVTNNHHITVRGHYLHRICEKTTKNITRSLLPWRHSKKCIGWHCIDSFPFGSTLGSGVGRVGWYSFS